MKMYQVWLCGLYLQNDPKDWTWELKGMFPSEGDANHYAMQWSEQRYDNGYRCFATTVREVIANWRTSANPEAHDDEVLCPT